MPRIYDIQNNFARGELSPRLHARTDIDHYRFALKSSTNWYVLRQGALRKRQGTEYIANVKDQSKATRLIPFVFSTTQAYMLEFGDQYFRPYANGARITETAVNITGATQANPVVITATSHGYSNGDRVFLADVGGMTEVNNREFTVANQTTNTFELSGIDGTGFTAYTSGGTTSKLVDFTTPYLEAELFELQFAQSADTLYVAHKSHAPRKITRTSDTAWTVTEIAFLDGPFLPEPDDVATTMSLSDTGNLIPQMTSNSAPSGTVTSDPTSSTAWQWADRNAETSDAFGSVTAGSWEYDPPAPDKVVVGYALRADNNNPQRALTEWSFEGFDGSDWVVLDTRAGEEGWTNSEERYYEFDNSSTYEKYRIAWTATDGGGSSEMAEIMFKESPDTMSAITLTASAVTGINDDQGFQTSDVGRSIRLKGDDGVWRWFKITARTSTTVVDGKLYGKPFRNTKAMGTWRMGAFSSETGYPASVSFFEERLLWARTNEEPQKIWGSKTFGFEDHGVSDPLVDDDAFTVEIASDQVNEIKWISEGQDLLIGTSDGIRTLGPSDTSKGFSATNLRQRKQTTTGASSVRPARIGTVALFADRFNMALHELLFSFESNSYIAPELSILSDHLLKSGIVEMDYAQSPDSLVWIAVSDGSLVTLTFERDQRIVGMCKQSLGGTAVSVESVAIIPGSTRSEVWVLVKRTINSNTVRYIERLSAEFEDTDIKNARFLDSYLERNSGSVTTVTGLGHLEGETVGVIADGLVPADKTVSGGKITLTTAATNIAVGLRYNSSAQQLRTAIQGRDGSLLGRRVNISEIIVDVEETSNLKVGRSGSEVDIIKRRAGEPMDAQIPPRTGTFDASIKGSWKDGGEVSFLSNQPLPATVRAVVRGMDNEP